MNHECNTKYSIHTVFSVLYLSAICGALVIEIVLMKLFSALMNPYLSML